MIKSMTGFGKGRAKSEFGNVIVEIKTINHRYFELSAKMPPKLSLIEYDIREQLQKKITRGRVNFFLDIESVDKTKRHVMLNDNLARSYRNKIKQLSKKINVSDNIAVSEIISLPGVMCVHEIPVTIEKVLPSVKKAVEQALKGIINTRRKEGRALAQDVSKRIKLMNDSLSKIKKMAPKVVDAYKNRMWQTFKKFKNVTVSDRDRLEKDIAVFAKNCDISEEICRIGAHLKSFAEVLKKGGETGKKLDFMAQELHRETTTIGSKANDFKISSEVIKMKSEIEKIREQLQNIE